MGGGESSAALTAHQTLSAEESARAQWSRSGEKGGGGGGARGPSDECYNLYMRLAAVTTSMAPHSFGAVVVSCRKNERC